MTATGGADEAVAVGRRAVRAARAQEIASNASDHGEGGLRAALFPEGRKLAIEFVVIAALIALTGFLVYHFTTHTIANKRPLGGANVDIAPIGFDQSQMAFAAVRGTLFGASNDTGGETLDVYSSSDAGDHWTHTVGPPVGEGCAQGSPQVAALRGGGELMAFLGAPECGKIQSLTPFLVVTARARTTGQWSRITRIAPSAWKYGFDDGPALAVSPRKLYLAWTRSYSKSLATTVVSSSANGKTWSAPVRVSHKLEHPHLATAAVAPDGTLYVAGIDAKHGLWLTESKDGGTTFASPSSLAQLANNPSATCAQTALQPLPREARACEGPDPTLLVAQGRLVIVYADFNANQTSDVFALGVDPKTLKPLYRVQVNPPDAGKTQQFVPAAAVDAKTGTLWACWYDTTFDPHARRVWFTCSASRNGRTWSQPVAAASKPSMSADVYGTVFATGLRPAVTASGGVAHAFWADSRNYEDGEDVETAAIPESKVFKR